MLSNYLQRGIHGRGGLIQAAYDRLLGLLANPGTNYIDRHWAFIDLCAKSVMLFDDLGAALWAGAKGELADYGRNVVRCQQSHITEMFQVAISGADPDKLARAWGFPTPAQLNQVHDLAPEDLQTVQAVQDGTVRELTKELRRIGRLRAAHLLLYNKQKHALAAVLVGVTSDQGREGVAVIKNPDAQTAVDTGQFYPLTSSTPSLWVWAVRNAAQMAQDVVRHRHDQIEYRDPEFLPAAVLGVGDLGARYGELRQRLYGDVLRVPVEMRVRISLDEAATRWLDEAEVIWNRLAE
jgi:hypothetical protein